jgi:hypothetical protein
MLRLANSPTSGLVYVFMTMLCASSAISGQTGWQREEVNLRLGNGLRIVAIKTPIASSEAMQSPTARLGTPPHPQPPLAGSSPLVAITTSDKRDSNDLNYEHLLEGTYDGTPLNPPASDNFIIGVFDSGAELNLIAEPYDIPLGLDGVLGVNGFPLGGVGGGVEAILTKPCALFIGSLDAIQLNEELDLTQVVGHSNVSIAVAPEINCGDAGSISGAIGAPMLAFYKAIIRNDLPSTVTVGGQTYSSPELQIIDPRDPNAPSLPVYPHRLTMTPSGILPPTTASFYALLEGLEAGDPILPTLLTALPGFIPTGGLFYADIGLLEGEPSPINLLKTANVIVDTGSQASIISPGMVGTLSLPLTEDFKVEVCGIGGLVEEVDGYYIDYVKFEAAGGALEFSQAPFVVVDLGSPDIDGVLGMNFFWNRNIIFDPNLGSFSYLHISDTFDFAYGDFDRDFDVDEDDFIIFQDCSTGPNIPFTAPECNEVDADDDADIDQNDFGIFQRCYSGAGTTADPNCGS